MQVVYEDNHLIIIYKESGEIVQGDKTGDEPLSEVVKRYIKEKYAKPGAVFLGVAHRLDRPVAGLVVFARTSKALARLNAMFRDGQVHKTYWAIVEVKGEKRAGDGHSSPSSLLTPHSSLLTPHSSLLTSHFSLLEHWLVRNERQNKSYAYDHEVPGSKRAALRYRPLGRSERYELLEVQLLTGRHHQIRCQLAAAGFPIKGDLKYGARRSNPDGSISLLARRVEFIHPVSKKPLCVEAPLPSDKLWQAFSQSVDSSDRIL